MITEEKIFECFAAAELGSRPEATAESFVDVEEYENKVMYPEFSRWAKKAGYPNVADLFLKVAGEEKLHATWIRALHGGMGVPPEGDDTRRATAALAEIRDASDRLLEQSPDGVVENALKVAIRVEEREYREIYPRFRDAALAMGDEASAEIYQRVIDSEERHAAWFTKALSEVRAARAV